MTREDIIRMAEEAGFNAAHLWRDGHFAYLSAATEAFARLIAEDCAKRCEAVGDQYDGTETTWAAESCAAAIREEYKP